MSANPVVLGVSGDLKTELEQHLTDLNLHMMATKGLADDVAALKATFAEAKTIIDSFNSRLANAQEQGKEIVPVSPKEWKEFGLTAMHNLPTVVRGVYKGGHLDGFDKPENPIRAFQEACDRTYLFARIKGIDPEIMPEAVKRLTIYKEELLPALKRMQDYLPETFKAEYGGPQSTGGSAGQGAEYVPTAYSATLWEKVRLALNVANLFLEIPMPRSPCVLPVWLNDLKAYAWSESVTGTDTSIQSSSTANTTANRTLYAWGIGGRTAVTRSLEEDSIIAMLSFLEMALVQALANGLEDALINGDRTNIGVASANQDYDITTAWDVKKALNGLRLAALSGSTATTAAGAGLTGGTAAGWLGIVNAPRKLMKKYGVNPAEIAVIVGGSTNINVIQNPDFRTAASLAGMARATVLTGSVQSQYGGFKPDGLNWVVSEFVREDVSATGKNASTANTTTTILCVNTRAWVIGNLRRITVQVLKEKYAENDMDGIVATMRVAFEQPIPVTATNPHTTIAVNVGL